MSEEDWKEILRNYLQNESESRIQKQNENSIYDQAYAVIILLIKKEIVSNWYDMEDILKQVNRGIVKDFWEKFNKKTPVQGNFDGEDRNANLQQKHFHHLSKEIGTNWKRFARQLNIEDNAIVNITSKCDNNIDRCFSVFLELKRRDGSVKWNSIKMALQELELKNTTSKFAF